MADAYNLSQATEWTEMRVALQNELSTIKRAVNDLPDAAVLLDGDAVVLSTEVGIHLVPDHELP